MQMRNGEPRTEKSERMTNGEPRTEKPERAQFFRLLGSRFSVLGSSVSSSSGGVSSRIVCRAEGLLQRFNMVGFALRLVRVEIGVGEAAQSQCESLSGGERHEHCVTAMPLRL